jgi:hypothetical protein
MEDDVGDRVEGARRQRLGRRDEVAGRVVDQPRQPARMPEAVGHLVDRLRIADVDAEGVDAALRKLAAPLGRRLFADALPAAADRDVGAQGEEPLGHRAAEAGAAAGHEDALAGHEIVLEHVGLLVLGVDRARCKAHRRATAPSR